MRALIFNSGLGSRLGALTRDNPKCMVKLSDGESILFRQLRILTSLGVDEFVITTGPFPEQVRRTAEAFSDVASFTFVGNDEYDVTNYIYSMFLAREHLRCDDLLVLHGDLVFDRGFADELMHLPRGSYGAVNASLPLPEKDFKARLADGRILEVSVDIFDGDCMAFQPFYRLAGPAIEAWIDAVERYVNAGERGVYAENAAAEVFGVMDVRPFSYEGHFVEEVDTPEDLERVSAGIRHFDFEQQPVFEGLDRGFGLVSGVSARRIGEDATVVDLLAQMGVVHPLVVASGRFDECPLRSALDEAGVEWTRFGGFSPNPTADHVAAGFESFRSAKCDSLVSFGGGSAIDVAKCIKARLAGWDGTESIEVGFSPVVHIAIPTTAGTGSESTRFAVCYVNGCKVSVTHDSLMPDAAVLLPALVEGLPDYQRKVTMLDALCHSIESYWSKSATDESRRIAGEAVIGIRECHRGYLSDDPAGNRMMLRMANRAGQAINLTTTTAAHAMSYALTSLFGIAHGHAVGLCLPVCWKVLAEMGGCSERKRLAELSAMLTSVDGASERDGLKWLQGLIATLGLERPKATSKELDYLVRSVNVERLGNFAIELDAVSLHAMYAEALDGC